MSWLMIEGDCIVNLDHIACIEILDMTATKKNRVPFQENPTELFHVALYPAEAETEPFTACTGSRSKCEDYMRALLEYVGGKEIVAVGARKCTCPCGCLEMIREDFLFCDDCADGFHRGNKEMVKEIFKKDAV